MQYRGLGKGLSALLKEEVVPINSNELVKIIDIEDIETRESQPRKNFEHEKIKELADSIKANGLLQPIIVNITDNDKYQIVAGERRWRACKLIGLNDISVIIKNLNEKEVLEIALVENIQREELSAIEEAEGFERLIKEFNYTLEQLAEMLGKSRSHIANMLRLNQLPASIKEKVNQSQLTMGHARCLVGNKDAEEIANQIIEKELSVRQTEHLVKYWGKNTAVKEVNNNGPKAEKQSDDLTLLAESLSDKFAINVKIENTSTGGKIVFHYNNLEELDAILSRLG